MQRDGARAHSVANTPLFSRAIFSGRVFTLGKAFFVACHAMIPAVTVKEEKGSSKNEICVDSIRKVGMGYKNCIIGVSSPKALTCDCRNLHILIFDASPLTLCLL